MKIRREATPEGSSLPGLYFHVEHYPQNQSSTLEKINFLEVRECSIATENANYDADSFIEAFANFLSIGLVSLAGNIVTKGIAFSSLVSEFIKSPKALPQFE